MAIDRLFIDTLRLVPKNTLSRAVGSAVRWRLGPLSNVSIRTYVRLYGIDPTEAAQPLESYRSLGEFFIRHLRPGARPVDQDPAVVVSPVDGTVLNGGVIEEGTLLQAKGRDYRLEELVGDPEEARAFEGGTALTVYLSPRDYHRIHAPLDARITGYAYIPGKLWPVNPPAVRNFARLFAVNERLITFMDTALGQVALVKVGATCVGRIKVEYDEITTNRPGTPAVRERYAEPKPIEKGQELGRFEMGSTVILLFQAGRVELADLQPGDCVKMGQPIGRAAG